VIVMVGVRARQIRRNRRYERAFRDYARDPYVTRDELLAYVRHDDLDDYVTRSELFHRLRTLARVVRKIFVKVPIDVTELDTYGIGSNGAAE
jgi:hypothetical protein